GLRRLGTETLDLVLLVRLEVALEPEPLRLAVLVEALPREDVGGDVVEEGAVVRDDHGAAGELQQRVLQARERLDVEVVGGLVEQEHVAALLEGERQVEPVALAAGEDLGGLLLVGALEAEGGDVGARGHLDLADHEVVQSVADGLPYALVARQAGAVLVDVGDLDGAADVGLARVGLLEADDGLEQGRLADAVGADDPDDAVAREAEVQAVDELLAVEALDQVLDFDDGAAEARPRRDLDLLEIELAGLLGFGGHLLVAAEPGLGLALASLGVRADPFELVPEALLELGVLAALHLHALGLLLQVGGVVALVRVGAAAVELEDLLGDVVEEVPVVRDGDDGAGVVGEVAFEPQHGLGVEVVGGLVEEQQVGLLEQELAQRHAAALTAGEVGDGPVAGRAAQGVHGLFELGVELPGVGGVEILLEASHLLHELVGVVGGHLRGDLVEAVELGLDGRDGLLDVLHDRLRLVQRRLLGQHADGGVGREPGLAVGDLVLPGHDPEQTGLAGAVGADHADLRTGEEVQGDVVEYDLVAVRLPRLFHAVNELRHADPSLTGY